jgi:hypothetical protein
MWTACEQHSTYIRYIYIYIYIFFLDNIYFSCSLFFRSNDTFLHRCIAKVHLILNRLDSSTCSTTLRITRHAEHSQLSRRFRISWILSSLSDAKTQSEDNNRTRWQWSNCSASYRVWSMRSMNPSACHADRTHTVSDLSQYIIHLFLQNTGSGN